MHCTKSRRRIGVVDAPTDLLHQKMNDRFVHGDVRVTCAGGDPLLYDIGMRMVKVVPSDELVGVMVPPKSWIMSRVM